MVSNFSYASTVVLHLMQDKLDRDRVFMDNFQNSNSLEQIQKRIVQTQKKNKTQKGEVTEICACLRKRQNNRGETLLKPEAIVAYNKYMSGIDCKDQMLTYDVCERKTLQWYYIYAGNKINLHDFRLQFQNILYQQNQTWIYDRHIIKKKCSIATTFAKNTQNDPVQGMQRMHNNMKNSQSFKLLLL